MAPIHDSIIGSSPPARGTRIRARREREVSRFIPARAGNTCSRRGGFRRRTVHPRPRGEHMTDHSRLASCAGSSPPARGTPTAVSTCPTWSAVHPRPRGEHSLRFHRCGLMAGSSPPARGTLVIGLRDHRRNRFIPARAGNTTASACGSSERPVHPRPRGEHPPAVTHQRVLYGSSPPARGTRLETAQALGRDRFIPARAGNTVSTSRISISRSVHPRPRGEHFRSSRNLSDSSGSSPPARGTHNRKFTDL